jgi:hypothetical protein
MIFERDEHKYFQIILTNLRVRAGSGFVAIFNNADTTENVLTGADPINFMSI